MRQKTKTNITNILYGLAGAAMIVFLDYLLLCWAFGYDRLILPF